MVSGIDLEVSLSAALGFPLETRKCHLVRVYSDYANPDMLNHVHWDLSILNIIYTHAAIIAII